MHSRGPPLKGQREGATQLGRISAAVDLLRAQIQHQHNRRQGWSPSKAHLSIGKAPFSGFPLLPAQAPSRRWLKIGGRPSAVYYSLNKHPGVSYVTGVEAGASSGRRALVREEPASSTWRVISPPTTTSFVSATACSRKYASSRKSRGRSHAVGSLSRELPGVAVGRDIIIERRLPEAGQSGDLFSGPGVCRSR